MYHMFTLLKQQTKYFFFQVFDETQTTLFAQHLAIIFVLMFTQKLEKIYIN